MTVFSQGQLNSSAFLCRCQFLSAVSFSAIYSHSNVKPEGLSHKQKVRLRWRIEIYFHKLRHKRFTSFARIKIEYSEVNLVKKLESRLMVVQYANHSSCSLYPYFFQIHIQISSFTSPSELPSKHS